MKIALIGYGKMGQEIANVIADSNSHSIVSISYKNSTADLDKEGIKKADVAIDFTSPEIVVKTIKEVAALRTNLVIGTTGWYDKLNEVKAVAKDSGIGLIYGQNFSIGANMFFQIVSFASELAARFGTYDIYGFEIHHKGKKDSPSGTARKLTEVIRKANPAKKTEQFDRVNRQIHGEELHFASIRGGFNPGYHEVVLDSMADEIRLVHAARGRRGFAEGAVLAAEFIKGKKGFYSVEDMFK